MMSVSASDEAEWQKIVSLFASASPTIDAAAEACALNAFKAVETITIPAPIAAVTGSMTQVLTDLSTSKKLTPTHIEVQNVAPSTVRRRRQRRSLSGGLGRTLSSSSSSSKATSGTELTYEISAASEYDLQLAQNAPVNLLHTGIQLKQNGFNLDASLVSTQAGTVTRNAGATGAVATNTGADGSESGSGSTADVRNASGASTAGASALAVFAAVLFYVV